MLNIRIYCFFYHYDIGGMMILILGKGIVGNAAIEYFNHCHKEIFIYDDNVVSTKHDIDHFQLWKQKVNMIRLIY
jgi:hypothetical protein